MRGKTPTDGSGHEPGVLQKAVWLARALACVVHARIGLTLRRTDALRAGIVARAPATKAQPWELRLAAWSVSAAARVVPGATCLTQALAGQDLLARRGRVSTVRITIPEGRREALRPHAWLLSDTVIVLGGTPQEFAVHRPLLHYRADSMTPEPVSATIPRPPKSGVPA